MNPMLWAIRALKDQAMAEYEEANAETLTPEQLALVGGGWGQVQPDLHVTGETI